MDGIAFGCLAARNLARAKISILGLQIVMVIGVAAVALIVIFRTQTFNMSLTKVGLNVTILEWGVALVLCALANGVGNQLLSKRTDLIQLVGRSSYEIYLTHMFVVFGLMNFFKALFGSSPHNSAYPITYQ